MKTRKSHGPSGNPMKKLKISDSMGYSLVPCIRLNKKVSCTMTGVVAL